MHNNIYIYIIYETYYKMYKILFQYYYSLLFSRIIISLKEIFFYNVLKIITINIKVYKVFKKFV